MDVQGEKKGFIEALILSAPVSNKYKLHQAFT
jgi:hypothetical protein